MWKKYGPFMLTACLGAAAGAFGGLQTAMAPLWPFSAIALGLRALSLSGMAGDVAAWILYASLSLLPLLALLPRKRKRGWADILIVLTTAYGFFYWYAMVNPGLFLADFFGGDAGMETVYRAMLTGMLYALLFGISVFRLTEESRSTRRVLSWLRIALYCVSLLLCWGEAFAIAVTISKSIGAEAVDIAYTAIQCACSLAVTLTLLSTLAGARALLGGMSGGWFANENEEMAAALSKRAKTLLATTVLSSLAQNGLALFMMGRVTSANISADVPITEFIFTCAFLLLSRFIRDGVRLRRENESFI